MSQGGAQYKEETFKTRSLPAWKKICYDSSQPYPDNYIDDALFLNELNADQDVSTEQITIRGVLNGASTIVQQISLVALFLSVSKCANRSVCDASTIAAFVVSLGVFDLVVAHVYRPGSTSLLENFLNLLLTSIFLRVAAPVLQTLTSSYSIDTIHALTLVFCSIHLVFYDYDHVHSSTDSDTFPGTISLNAAMFTAVLLASRMKSVHIVVTFVMLAVMLFSRFPSTARLMKQNYEALYHGVTLFLMVIVCALLYDYDKTILIIYLCIVFLVCIICPLWLIYMQRYKSIKSGPWDIVQI